MTTDDRISFPLTAAEAVQLYTAVNLLLMLFEHPPALEAAFRAFSDLPEVPGGDQTSAAYLAGLMATRDKLQPGLWSLEARLGALTGNHNG